MSTAHPSSPPDHEPSDSEVLARIMSDPELKARATEIAYAASKGHTSGPDVSEEELRDVLHGLS